jgi:transcription initiation factor TFIIIB Brf1 subunit/transcription initiation factor TFIIB
MTSGMMRMLGFAPTLSEVDRTQEDMRAEIDILSERMHLPEVIRAEALQTSFAMPAMQGSTVRERAIFCIYMAGKKQGSPKADITCLSNALRSFDSRWTRGRILRSIGQIHAKLDPDFLARIGPVVPTSVESYIDHIFSALSSSHPRALKGLRAARTRALEIVAGIRRDHPDSMVSRSPRTQAAYITYLALREVEWKQLGIRAKDVVGAKEVVAVAEVSRKSVVGH